MKALHTQIRTLLADSLIDQALDELDRYAQDERPDWRPTITNLKGRWSALLKQQIEGTVGHEDFSLEANRIRRDMLTVLSHTEAPPRRGQSLGVLFLLIFSIGLCVFALFTLFPCSNSLAEQEPIAEEHSPAPDEIPPADSSSTQVLNPPPKKPIRKKIPPVSDLVEKEDSLIVPPVEEPELRSSITIDSTGIGEFPQGTRILISDIFIKDIDPLGAFYLTQSEKEKIMMNYDTDVPFTLNIPNQSEIRGHFNIYLGFPAFIEL